MPRKWVPTISLPGSFAMSLLLAQRNWAKSEAEYMHERLRGKVIFRLSVSKLSFPSAGMWAWKRAPYSFGFTSRVELCSLRCILWRLFCELKKNNGPLYMLSRFLARKKNGLAGFMIIRGPIHHGCGGSSLKCTVVLQSLPTTSYHGALETRFQLWPLLSLWHQ